MDRKDGHVNKEIQVFMEDVDARGEIIDGLVESLVLPVIEFLKIPGLLHVRPEATDERILTLKGAEDGLTTRGRNEHLNKQNPSAPLIGIKGFYLRLPSGSQEGPTGHPRRQWRYH